MKISICKCNGNMHAILDNPKDDLYMTLHEHKCQDNIDFYVTYSSSKRVTPDIMHGSVAYEEQQAPKLRQEVHLNTLHFDEMPYLYGHTLEHVINMLRGFFNSRKYTDYVIKNDKHSSLLAKKARLERKISKIDKQLTDQY